METQHLYIKNMMCPRCEIVIRQTMMQLNVNLLFLEIGHAEIEKIDSIKYCQLEEHFNEVGFELLYDSNSKIIELIKLFCREHLKNIENRNVSIKMSDYLSVSVGKNYSFLSKLFSSQEGRTIESYFLKQKIERVKQILSYGELSLSEIAILLDYSSVHYLSSQFRKIEGCTASSFVRRKNLPKKLLTTLT